MMMRLVQVLMKMQGMRMRMKKAMMKKKIHLIRRSASRRL
jgi:hypothetical protein